MIDTPYRHAVGKYSVYSMLPPVEPSRIDEIRNGLFLPVHKEKSKPPKITPVHTVESLSRTENGAFNTLGHLN